MSKQSKQVNSKSIGWKKEAILIGCMTLLLLLFISNFGVGGVVGHTISSFFFGIFGVISYILPLLVGIIILFLVSNNTNRIARIKGISAIILILLICAFVELLYHGNEVPTFREAFNIGYNQHQGGGVIGCLYTKALVPAIALVASYIVNIAAIFICLIIITEKALLSIFSQKSKKAVAVSKEHYDANHEKREERKAQRKEEKQRRMDCKVSGVALNTKLDVNLEKPKDEMSELKVTKRKQNKKKVKPVDTIKEEIPDMVIHGMVPSSQHDINENALNSINKSSENSSNISHRRSSSSVQKSTSDTTKDDIDREMRDQQMRTKDQDAINEKYEYPPLDLLQHGTGKKQGDSEEHLRKTAQKLEDILNNFGVHVKITDVSCGPTVTRYELQPEMGVKVSKIVSLSDDIKLNLAASDIRIEAPIPGKAAVGIEVPNKENITVMFRELVDTKVFQKAKSKISFAVGKDIGGQTIVSNIAKMPHLLIAGATGSGKSVCINTIIMSILYKARPDEVKLIMIDPKVVELSVYNGIPHLMIPVVTDPKKAAGALNWAVAEMTNRYQKFAECNVRDLSGYNDKIAQLKKPGESSQEEKMPQIVIIVDELADLMMVASKEVEDAICRLAQLARAAGIHLIIATQRPSVNVITGVIKANMPSRIAFSVSSGVDSRTIIDSVGAEKLLGKGDMLFYPQGYQKPLRVQGAFITDKEVSDVVKFLKERNQVAYNKAIEEHLKQQSENNNVAINGSTPVFNEERDQYFIEAGKLLVEKERGSIGMLQRVFKIGFNRAARIMDQLEEIGIVGPEEGTKPRKILVTQEEFEKIVEQL